MRGTLGIQTIAPHGQDQSTSTATGQQAHSRAMRNAVDISPRAYAALCVARMGGGYAPNVRISQDRG